MTGDRVNLAVLVFAGRAQHHNTGESRPTAHRVDDGGTGEVAEIIRAEVAAAPDPVTGHRVDQRDEHEAENDERADLDALGHGARHDGRGGAGKDQGLEKEFCPERHRRPVDGIVNPRIGRGGERIHRFVTSAQRRRIIRPADKPETGSAEPGIAVTKHQAPAQHPKGYRGDGENDEVFGQDVDAVLGLAEAGFHKGETGVHPEHEHARDQDPHRVQTGAQST